MMVCAVYNGLMESDARVAASARGWGHKLAVWESLSHPVFDRGLFRWFVLLPDGAKVLTEWSDKPF
jgi:hypothetical protein